MNLGIRKEEACYLYDIMITDIAKFGIEALSEAYGNIDFKGILRQLQIIMEIGESITEEVEW